MYLGRVDRKWQCSTSRNISNDSVLITGGSGAGKSVRTHMIELECAKENATVIVPDMGFTHCLQYLFPPLVAEYERYVNRIEASDGINLNLFRDGNSEISIVTLGDYYGMGLRQMAVLREAVSAINNFPPGGDDLAILNFVLQKCGGQVLQEKMQALLNCGIVRQDKSRIQQGKINIIDLSLLDSDVQGPLSELILAHCWRYLQKKKGDMGNVVISLDEIQNLTFNRKNSPLRRMLREGRKFRMSFLLATQTLSTFSPDTVSVLHQAATQLYFRPPANEIEKIAHAIEADKEVVWRRKLARLKVGQCIAKGELSVNGVIIEHPLILW